MKIETPLWPADINEARALQEMLRHKVRLESSGIEPSLVAGVDCSLSDEGTMSYAFIVLMRMGDFHPLHVASAKLPTAFPYVPGFLSFREIPVILKALERLPETPDMLMVDGQGVAHPRRLGIAAHLGVLMDLPTIGVAKSRLCGRYEPLGEAAGSSVKLMDKDERIGTVLRSKKNCNPLFISAGHRMTQEEALAITLRSFKGYRLPEPTRIADKISKSEKLSAT